MAQRRAKDIEEKEETGRHKKAPQPSYDQLKVPDEGVADFQVGSSFETHAALLGGTNTDTQRSDLAMHLQKTYGNRYVQRLVESTKVQAKLTVDSPDDEYEREADKVADAVTRAPASSVQRQVPEEEEEEKEPVVEIRTKMSRIQRQVTESKEGEKEEEVAVKHTPEIERSAAPVLQRQKDIPGGPEKPPKTTSDPKEVATKVLEAVSKTELGKKCTKKLMAAATSKEGIAVISTLAVPALTAAFAEKMEVPQGLVGLVPKIAKFEVGKNVEVSFQPIYKGKFGEKPREWGGKVNLVVRW
jgi:hypothetical protein